MLEAITLSWINLLFITLPVGAAIIWIVPDVGKVRWIALVTAILDLCLALIMLFKFDPDQTGFQYVAYAPWIPTLNVNFHVGVDGISVFMLPLSIGLVIATIVASWNSIGTMPRLYYSLLLLLESATLGVFCAIDTILFLFCWEITLIPLFFLISFWGLGANRRYAAVKYTMLMTTGGVFLLFAFVLLALNHLEIRGTLTFDYQTLLVTPVSAELQVTLFFLLLLGFAPKIPLFPFHTWLPTVAMEGPISVSVLMTGMKLGAFGLIRFLVPLAPDAAREFDWLLAGIGITGVIYGALLALAQTNLRRMLAYASISHVGLVVIGVASFNVQGIQGAVFQLINFTIIAGGLFLVTGFLHYRTGSTDMLSLGGIVKTMPFLTAFFFLFALAFMGVPGSNGFPAEFLILLSTFESHKGVGLAILVSMVLSAAYFLTMYGKSFLGPVRSDVVAQCMDLRPRELAIVLVFAFLVLLFGLYPAIVLDTINATTIAWLQQVSR